MEVREMSENAPEECRLRAVPRGKGLRKVGTADNTGRNEIRVAHTTQNSHWSKSMCPSIKSYYAINNFQT